MCGTAFTNLFYTIRCLAQLASLCGHVFADKAQRVKYLTAFLEQLLPFLTAYTARLASPLSLPSCVGDQMIGISNIMVSPSHIPYFLFCAPPFNHCCLLYVGSPGEQFSSWRIFPAFSFPLGNFLEWVLQLHLWMPPVFTISTRGRILVEPRLLQLSSRCVARFWYGIPLMPRAASQIDAYRTYINYQQVILKKKRTEASQRSSIKSGIVSVLWYKGIRVIYSKSMCRLECR